MLIINILYDYFFFSYNDFLESELSQELENGRLVRLLCKFGFINERPEYVLLYIFFLYLIKWPKLIFFFPLSNNKFRFDMDPSWSETGDRYLIKLFRDYVFHQVDENGYPVVDMAHVLMCLNKVSYYVIYIYSFNVFIVTFLLIIYKLYNY